MKKLSYILRHKPQSEGLEMDKYGYVDTKALIKALNITIEELIEIVDKYNIAYPTGESVKSGWVTYPVYELTDEAFEEFNRQINRYGV